MAPTNSSSTTVTSAPYWSQYETSSGTISWSTEGTDGSGWRGAHLVGHAQYNYNYIPSELDDVEAIQGEPKGAKFLISYAYKKSKDPVIFLQSKKDMIKMLQALWNDELVDRKTILVHEIAKQYKPRVKKVVVEELDIEAYGRK